MKSLTNNILVFTFIITCLAPLNLMANDLPDEINHPHYFQIYKDKKYDSDIKRDETRLTIY